MYFQFSCTGCDKKLKVREEKIGSKIRCPYCKHSMVVEPPPEPATPDFPAEGPSDQIDFSGIQIDTSEKSTNPVSIQTEQPTAQNAPASQPKPDSTPESHEQWSDSTEVGTTKSAIIGLVIAVIFYVPVYGIYVLSKGKSWYLIDLFCARGWVPFALVFLMGWSAAILYLKSQKLKRQRESMLFDLLPNEISEHITMKSSREFVRHIRQLPIHPGESFLVNRVLRGPGTFSNSSEQLGSCGSTCIAVGNRCQRRRIELHHVEGLHLGDPDSWIYRDGYRYCCCCEWFRQRDGGCKFRWKG